jgi:signal transduction histidine kinase
MGKKPLYQELAQRVKELERELAERNPREENLAWLASFPERNPILITEADRNGRVCYLNPVARRSLPDLEAKGFRHPWFADVSRLSSTAGEGQEIVIREVAIAESTYQQTIFYLPELERLRIYGVDITLLRKAQQALEIANRQLLDIIEFLPDATFVIDHDRKVIAWNRAIEEMTGVKKADILGQRDYAYAVPFYGKRRPILVDLVLDSHLEIVHAYDPLVRRENLVSGQVHVPMAFGGKGAYIEATASALFDASGKLIGAIESVRDITERKRAEEEKQKLEAQLFHAQKMEAIGTLAGGIAHDFNNLLMGIQGRASLMMLTTSPEHPHCEHLAGIEEIVQRAAGLTRQLLGFARSGKYEVKPTDLNDLVQKSSEMFGRTKKEITIIQTYGHGLWPVEVDRGQIEQVLLNLYVNAWQAMPKGGTLTLQTENVTLDETNATPFEVTPGNYVRITVSDTGVGMDEETKRRIFEPFFTTKEMGRGTGLGLASAYGIIKNHGGMIRVYSRQGLGTTFKISLPASTGITLDEYAASPDLMTGKETILLVDDEGAILEVGARMLEALGYRVFPARGGKEALEVYRNNQAEVDLVILDMIMPDMGGEDTFEHLYELNPKVKVLLASGYSFENQIDDILEHKCSGFIQKPFDLKQLSHKVRQVLDRPC